MTDAKTACPACGSTEFQLYRGPDWDGFAFSIYCADCDNPTALVRTQALDPRLQGTDEQLTEWSG